MLFERFLAVVGALAIAAMAGRLLPDTFIGHAVDWFVFATVLYPIARWSFLKEERLRRRYWLAFVLGGAVAVPLLKFVEPRPTWP